MPTDVELEVAMDDLFKRSGHGSSCQLHNVISICFAFVLVVVGVGVGGCCCCRRCLISRRGGPGTVENLKG